MKPPYVIHVNEMADHPGAMYIGRYSGRGKRDRSKWANPFRITNDTSRREVIDMFRIHMTAGEGRHLIDDLAELTGKPLACWCRRAGDPVADGTACHGDILIDLWRKHVAAIQSGTDFMARYGDDPFHFTGYHGQRFHFADASGEVCIRCSGLSIDISRADIDPVMPGWKIIWEVGTSRAVATIGTGDDPEDIQVIMLDDQDTWDQVCRMEMRAGAEQRGDL